MSNEDTGQSEELSPEGQQVEENGDLNAEANANSDANTDHEGEQGEQVQQPSKSRSSKQRLRRKLEESEIARQKLEEDNRKQADRLNTLEKKVDGVINPPPPRPSRVDYESEEDYEDALYEFRQNSGESQQSSADTSDQQNSEAPKPSADNTAQNRPQVSRETVERWKDSCDDAADKYDDFDEVLNDKTTPITFTMGDAIMESVNPGEVAYHLNKNKKEAERISKLSMIGQIKEIDNIAKKFAPSTSNSPAPIDVPKGTDDFSEKDPEKMSPDQYRADRRRKKANK